jgi:molybdate transport system substrate-binding protein
MRKPDIRGVFFALIGAVLLMAAPGPARADELVLFGAGSLREAMTQIARDFQAKTGTSVRTVFGPSGVMRERIEKGERVDVFTSADMGHPLRLERQGQAVAVAMFARNAVCAFSMPRVGLTTSGLLDKLLDPKIRLGTSAPVTDPLGDYTWQMFKRADSVKPGSSTTLANKAHVLVGRPGPRPEGQDPIAAALTDGTVDVFLGYCSERPRFDGQVPGLGMTPLPEALSVGPEYGVALLAGAQSQATSLVFYILSPAGQTTLARHGFNAIGLPSP